MNSSFQLLMCLALGVTSCALTGCGDSGPQGVEVSGKVTLNGLPLEQGNLEFVPLGEGRSASAAISHGAYQISAEAGPTAGEYRVEITCMVGTGKMIEDPDLPDQQIEQTRQIIPVRYNLKSDLRASIPSDDGMDFALEAKGS